MKSATKKFFNLENELKIIKNNFNIENDFIFCVNGKRNIGKSTGTWGYAEKNSLRPNKKMVLLRVLDTQLKFLIKDFNARFLNRFHATATHIYELHEEAIEVKGETVQVFKKGEVVGYCMSLSTYTTAKSGTFDNVNFIFFEEYNENTNTNLGSYEKFINLITTCMRFNKVIVVLMGNRDTANNEFMVSWGIEPREEAEVKIDVLTQFSKRGFFLEIGDDTYKGLGNEDTLFYELSQFNNTTARYLDGGYIQDFSRQVKNFNKWVSASFVPRFAFGLGGGIYTYGLWMFEGRKVSYIVSDRDYYNDKILIRSLDRISDTENKTKLLREDDRDDIINLIYSSNKKLELFFNSFDTQTNIMALLFLHRMER